MFEGKSVQALKKAFHEAVDDYLETCREMVREPNKPFKGSFNVRVPVELHRKAATKAAKLGLSLNQLVQKALEDKLPSKGDWCCPSRNNAACTRASLCLITCNITLARAVPTATGQFSIDC
jgi:hypothetical protein